MRVTVIDYKAGNLTSVLKALTHLGAETVVTDGDLAPIENAERIVLPGVGNFRATERLDETGMTGAIRAAIARGVPFLGICVGMQWLMEGSEEAPERPGLGIFAGRCKRFSNSVPGYKVPHVGWNTILPRVKPASRLLAGIRPTDGGEYAYFTHSYYVPSQVSLNGGPNPRERSATSITTYIEAFASAVEHKNVFGVQFHPEKSDEAGLKILRNFLEMRR